MCQTPWSYLENKKLRPVFWGSHRGDVHWNDGKWSSLYAEGIVYKVSRTTYIMYISFHLPNDPIRSGLFSLYRLGKNWSSKKCVTVSKGKSWNWNTWSLQNTFFLMADSSGPTDLGGTIIEFTRQTVNRAGIFPEPEYGSSRWLRPQSPLKSFYLDQVGTVCARQGVGAWVCWEVCGGFTWLVNYDLHSFPPWRMFFALLMR